MEDLAVTPLATYAPAVGGRRYEQVVYSDKTGFILRVYDARADELAWFLRLDATLYGTAPGGAPWSRTVWRAWLRAGAEQLLFRVGVLQLHLSQAHLADS